MCWRGREVGRDQCVVWLLILIANLMGSGRESVRAFPGRISWGGLFPREVAPSSGSLDIKKSEKRAVLSCPAFLGGSESTSLPPPPPPSFGDLTVQSLWLLILPAFSSRLSLLRHLDSGTEPLTMCRLSRIRQPLLTAHSLSVRNTDIFNIYLVICIHFINPIPLENPD